jgi:hypothetical protein
MRDVRDPAKSHAKADQPYKQHDAASDQSAESSASQRRSKYRPWGGRLRRRGFAIDVHVLCFPAITR